MKVLHVISFLLCLFGRPCFAALCFDHFPSYLCSSQKQTFARFFAATFFLVCNRLLANAFLLGRDPNDFFLYPAQDKMEAVYILKTGDTNPEATFLDCKS